MSSTCPWSTDGGEQKSRDEGKRQHVVVDTPWGTDANFETVKATNTSHHTDTCPWDNAVRVDYSGPAKADMKAAVAHGRVSKSYKPENANVDTCPWSNGDVQGQNQRPTREHIITNPWDPNNKAPIVEFKKSNRERDNHDTTPWAVESKQELSDKPIRAFKSTTPWGASPKTVTPVITQAAVTACNTIEQLQASKQEAIKGLLEQGATEDQIMSHLDMMDRLFEEKTGERIPYDARKNTDGNILY